MNMSQEMELRRNGSGLAPNDHESVMWDGDMDQAYYTAIRDMPHRTTSRGNGPVKVASL